MAEIRTVKRYTNGTQEVQAIQFMDNAGTIGNLSDWFMAKGVDELRIDYAEPLKPVCKIPISGTNDYAKAPEGWYIVRNTNGDFFPCTPAVFYRNYERIE